MGIRIPYVKNEKITKRSFCVLLKKKSKVIHVGYRGKMFYLFRPLPRNRIWLNILAAPVSL